MLLNTLVYSQCKFFRKCILNGLAALSDNIKRVLAQDDKVTKKKLLPLVLNITLP